jgi:uncharacterized protein (TIGR00288 family)
MNQQQPHAHLPRPAHKEPPAHAPNAALLIDFDNVTMAIRSDLQSELKRLLQSDIIRGKVAVQRAYADWRRYPQYIVPLSESSIDLIWAPAHGANKKNATDIRLAVDALELVFTRPEIGTFILLSGDSDFSSMVLKLKEYGKYVIGVGIRESSSDLLIQNCDEYYSYNELAGFTKESDVEYVRRDPWELVVEAVKQMTGHNDVMRSDRLKQVMQEIDPNFDEKDAGFSRFSKFVVEAAHRGLISLTRMDNGQYEIALGPEVSDAAAAPARREGASAGAEPERAPRARGEGRGRRGGSGGRGRGGAFEGAVGLIKQALGRLGGEERPVGAEELRETVNELKPGDQPLEAGQMQQLLRKAHDREIVDLSKEEDGAYTVKLRPEGAEAAAPPTLPPPPPPAREFEEEAEDEPPQPASSAPPPPYSQPAGGMPARSARFRRGSKGGGPRPGAPGLPKIGVVEVDPNFRPRIEIVPTKPPAGEAAPPMGETSFSGNRAETPGREPREGRGGGGGGGGRGRGSRGGRGRSRAGDEREGSEGGRGRGGRGGSRGGAGRNRGGSGGGGGGRHEREESFEPRSRREPQAPSAPLPPAPPPPPTPKPKVEEAGGESFWSRVKRGLTGGE